MIFILLTIVYATCFFQLFSMQPLFYSREWHFSKPAIGTLMALNGILICIIEMVLIHKLEGRRHPLRYISIGIILVGAGFVLLKAGKDATRFVAECRKLRFWDRAGAER